MAKQKKDDVAAALDAMMQTSDGSDHGGEEDLPLESPEPSPPAPAAPPLSADSPADPAPRERTVSPMRAAAPQNPRQTARPSQPVSARPATPDEAVARPRPRPAPPARQSKFQSLEFRRTLIPPLLTGCVLTLIFGLLPHVMPQSSPFVAVPQSISIMLLILSAALAATAAINMILVRQQLADR